MHNALILTAVAFFGWAFGDICATISSRKIGSYSSVFWTNLIGVVLFSFLIPQYLPNLSHYTPLIFLYNLGISALLLIGNLTYVTALQKSNASIVSTIAGSFSAVTIILSVFLYGDTISGWQVVAIVTTFVGITLSTLNLNDLSQKGIWRDPSLKLALIAMLTWGAFYALLKPIISTVGWFWPSYITFCFFPVVYLYIRYQKLFFNLPNFKGALPYVIGGAILLRAAEAGFNIALNRGAASLVAPIAGAYPVLFVILAAYLFKDPIKLPQKFGIGVTLVGIVWLSWLSR
jgi:drug/metabolite transporter (DMT)-like permease